MTVDSQKIATMVKEEPLARVAVAIAAVFLVGLIFSSIVPGYLFLCAYIVIIFMLTGEPMNKALIGAGAVTLASVMFYALGLTPAFKPALQAMIIFMILGFSVSFFAMPIRQSSDSMRDENIYIKREIAKLKDDLKKREQRDMTSRSEAGKLEARLKDRIMKVTMVLAKVRDLGAELDYSAILEVIEDIISGDVGATKFSVFLVDHDRAELFPVKIHGYPEEYMKLIVPLKGESLIEVSAMRGAVIVEDEARTDTSLVGLMKKGPVKTLYAAPLMGKDRIMGVINIEETGPEGISKYNRTLLDTISTIAGLTMNNARVFDQTREALGDMRKLSEEQLAKNATLKEIFGRYVSKNLVNQIVDSGEEIALGGRKEHVVALFSDIRGFTTLCEGHDAAEIVELLNEYLTAMTEIIFKYDGTLDKFIGDAIMALYGVPIHQKDAHLKAVMTAVEMQASLKKLQKKWASAGKLNIDMGIGIHCGMAIVGNIGSMDRMDYTAIGDTINLAARLEENAKRGQILISEAVYYKVREEVVVESMGNLQVKGKSEWVKTFNVTSLKDDGALAAPTA